MKKIQLQIEEQNIKNKKLALKINSESGNYKSFTSLLKNCNINEENVLKDVVYESKISKVWRNYLKKKFLQSQSNLSINGLDSDKAPISDDALCSVCNDGDYEDNNLIVYCSVS